MEIVLEVLLSRKLFHIGCGYVLLMLHLAYLKEYWMFMSFPIFQLLSNCSSATNSSCWKLCVFLFSAAQNLPKTCTEIWCGCAFLHCHLSPRNGASWCRKTEVMYILYTFVCSLCAGGLNSILVGVTLFFCLSFFFFFLYLIQGLFSIIDLFLVVKRVVRGVNRCDLDWNINDTDESWFGGTSRVVSEFFNLLLYM